MTKKTGEKKFVLVITLSMQQLYCLYTAEDNSNKNIFYFGYQLLCWRLLEWQLGFMNYFSADFLSVQTRGFSYICWRYFWLYISFVWITYTFSILIGTNWQIWILCCVALYLAIVEYRTWQAGQPGIIHSQVLNHILHTYSFQKYGLKAGFTTKNIEEA